MNAGFSVLVMLPYTISQMNFPKMNLYGMLQSFDFPYSTSSILRIRCQLGLVYLHLAIDSKFLEIRRSVNPHVVQATARAPQLANRLIGDALASFLSRGDPSSKAASTPANDQVQPWNKQSLLSTLLLSVVSFGDDVDVSLRENIVVEYIVLAHHHLLCLSAFV